MVDKSFNNFHNLINHLRQGGGNRLTPPLEDERSIIALMDGDDSDDDSDGSDVAEVKVENITTFDELPASHFDEQAPRPFKKVKLSSQNDTNDTTEVSPLLNLDDEEVAVSLSDIHEIVFPLETRPVVVSNVDDMLRPVVPKPLRDMTSERMLYNTKRVEANLSPCDDPTCTMCIPDFHLEKACGQASHIDANAGNTTAHVPAKTDKYTPSMALGSMVPSTSPGSSLVEFPASHFDAFINELKSPSQDDYKYTEEEMDALLSDMDAMVSRFNARPVVAPNADDMLPPVRSKPLHDMASRQWLSNTKRVEENLPPCNDPICTISIPDFHSEGACGPASHIDANAGNTTAHAPARTHRHTLSMALGSSMPSTSRGSPLVELPTPHFDKPAPKLIKKIKLSSQNDINDMMEVSPLLDQDDEEVAGLLSNIHEMVFPRNTMLARPVVVPSVHGKLLSVVSKPLRDMTSRRRLYNTKRLKANLPSCNDPICTISIPDFHSEKACEPASHIDANAGDTTAHAPVKTDRHTLSMALGSSVPSTSPGSSLVEFSESHNFDAFFKDLKSPSQDDYKYTDEEVAALLSDMDKMTFPTRPVVVPSVEDTLRSAVSKSLRDMTSGRGLYSTKRVEANLPSCIDPICTITIPDFHSEGACGPASHIDADAGNTTAHVPAKSDRHTLSMALGSSVPSTSPGSSLVEFSESYNFDAFFRDLKSPSQEGYKYTDEEVAALLSDMDKMAFPTRPAVVPSVEDTLRSAVSKSLRDMTSGRGLYSTKRVEANLPSCNDPICTITIPDFHSEGACGPASHIDADAGNTTAHVPAKSDRHTLSMALGSSVPSTSPGSSLVEFSESYNFDAFFRDLKSPSQEGYKYTDEEVAALLSDMDKMAFPTRPAVVPSVEDTLRSAVSKSLRDMTSGRELYSTKRVEANLPSCNDPICTITIPDFHSEGACGPASHIDADAGNTTAHVPAKSDRHTLSMALGSSVPSTSPGSSLVEFSESHNFDAFFRDLKSPSQDGYKYTDEEVAALLSDMDKMAFPTRPVVVPSVEDTLRSAVSKSLRDMTSGRGLYSTKRVEANLPSCNDPICTITIPDLHSEGACGPASHIDADAGNTTAHVPVKTDRHTLSMTMGSSVPSTSHGASKGERSAHFDNVPKWSQTYMFEAPKWSDIFKDRSCTTGDVSSDEYPEWNVKFIDESPKWTEDSEGGVPEWIDAFQDGSPKRDAGLNIGSAILIAATTDEAKLVEASELPVRDVQEFITDEAKPDEASEEAVRDVQEFVTNEAKPDEVSEKAVRDVQKFVTDEAKPDEASKVVSVRDVQEFIRKHRTPEHLRQCAQLSWPSTTKDLPSSSKTNEKNPLEDDDEDDENTAFAMSDEEWLYYDLIYESFSDDESD